MRAARFSAGASWFATDCAVVAKAATALYLEKIIARMDAIAGKTRSYRSSPTRFPASPYYLLSPVPEPFL
ncbi:hypothetical protein EMIT048CA2_130013 [Pseudomonas chlororaphis]